MLTMETGFDIRKNFEVGERAQLSKTISEEDISSFARMTGDYNPIHINDNFASKTRFKKRIAHGLISVSLIATILGTKLPGTGGIYITQNLKFVRPVYIGDSITAEVEVVDWNPAKRILRLNTHCFNQDKDDVIVGEAVLLVETLNG
jgi:3-hydroxybutyryl-CoA dehydratase